MELKRGTKIHGTEDPILAPINGETLARSISGTKFVLLNGFGHVLNRHFYSIIIEEIKQIANIAQ